MAITYNTKSISREMLSKEKIVFLVGFMSSAYNNKGVPSEMLLVL